MSPLMHFTILIGFFLVVNIGLVSANDGVFSITGVMPPNEDVFVLAGKSFELNCTVRRTYSFPNGSSTVLPQPTSLQDNETVQDANQTAPSYMLTGSDLILDTHKIALYYGSQRIPTQQLNYFENELTVQFRKNVSTFNDSGTYFCFYENATNRSFLNLKTIKVGELPGKPSIACLSNSFLDMVCYVTLNKKQGNIACRWQMEFKTSSINGPDRSILCNETKQEGGASDVLKFVLPEGIKMFEVYDVTVIGTPKIEPYNASVTSTIEIMADFSIVKPAKVNNLRSQDISSTGAMLLWDYPDNLVSSMKSNILQFEVLVTAEQEWDHRKLALLHDPQKNPDTVLLTDLVCNANYSVAIRSRPDSAVGEIYWSKWDNITFHTPQDIPHQSTELSWGSFYIDDNTQNDSMSVVLYWKNPPIQYRCGHIKGYKVKVFQISNGMVFTEASEFSTVQYETQAPQLKAKVTEVLTGYQEFSLLDVRLSPQERYIIDMFTENGNGISSVFSELLLPKWFEAKSARVDLVTVEMHDGKALVSWEIKEELCDHVTEVIYYWCRPDQDKNMSNSYALCKDGFDWMTVSADNGCTNGSGSQWLDAVADMSNMRFAVAVRVDNITGGMVWDKFNFKTYDAVPGTPQYQVSPVPDDDTKVKVTLLYNKVYNHEEGGRPEDIVVNYAQSEDAQHCHKGPSKKFSVNLNNPVIILEGLNPDTSYVVCGRFSNRYGKGRFGKAQTVKTTGAEDDTLWQWLAAVLGGGVVLFIIILIVCLRGAKNRISQSTKIDVPNIGPDLFLNHDYPKKPELTEMDGMDKYDSDSGRGTSTQTSSSNSSQQDSGEDGPLDHENTPILGRSGHEEGVYELDSKGSVLSGYMDVTEYRSNDIEEDLFSFTNEESGVFNDSFVLNDDNLIDDAQFNTDGSSMNQGRFSRSGNKKVSISHYTEIDDIAIGIDGKNGNDAGVFRNNISSMLDGRQMTSIKHETDDDFELAEVSASNYALIEDEDIPVRNDKDTTAVSTVYLHSVDQGRDCTKNGSDCAMDLTEQARPVPSTMAYTSATSTRDIKPDLPSPALLNQSKDSISTSDNSGNPSPFVSAYQTDFSKNTTDTRNAAVDEIENVSNEKHDNTQTPPKNSGAPNIDFTNENTNNTQLSTATSVKNSEERLDDKTYTIPDEGSHKAVENDAGQTLAQRFLTLGQDQTNVMCDKRIESLVDLDKTADSQPDDTGEVPDNATIDDDTTDIFSEKFDDLMIDSDFDCYQNPDALSLGQGSIISDGSEEVRSIRSFTSDGLDRNVEGNAVDRDTETDVVKLCNKIKTEFVVDVEKTDEGEKTEHNDKTELIDVAGHSNETSESVKNELDDKIDHGGMTKYSDKIGRGDKAELSGEIEHGKNTGHSDKIGHDCITELSDKADHSNKTDHIIIIPDVIRDKHKLSTDEPVRDTRSVNSGTSVEEGGKRNTSGGSVVEVNSYVTAWNKV